MPRQKRILYPVLFMIIITIVFTSVLAIVNELAKDRIEIQSKLKQQTKILKTFNIIDLSNTTNINEQYNQKINEKTIDNISYFEAVDDGKLIGYAFIVEGSGLWGKITALIAFDSEFKTILGVDFLSHSETPGLGGRIDEEWFIEQFDNILVLENRADNLLFKPAIGGNIDSISGATLTSKAVIDLFNQQIIFILSDIKGGLQSE